MGIGNFFNKEKREASKEKREAGKALELERARLEAEVAAISGKIDKLDENMISELCKKGMTREQAIAFMKKNNW
jgi:hypothetical protein